MPKAGVRPLPVYLIHWNAPEWVSSAAASILASDIAVDVTVVDNGPPEATATLALPDEVRVLTSGGNLGYSGGANVALRDWLNAGAAWCVVGAHDLHVSDSDLRLMLEAGRMADSFGILGPGTTEHGGRPYYAGEFIDSLDGLEERTVMSGTCLLLRRECILQIGLFDTQFGSYAEDDELCSRARSSGWKVGRVLAAEAHGLGSQAENRQHLLMRNWVLLAMKTSGTRRAGLRVLRGHLRLLLVALVKWVYLNQERAIYREAIRERAYALWHGSPLLWARMIPPPSA